MLIVYANGILDSRRQPDKPTWPQDSLFRFRSYLLLHHVYARLHVIQNNQYKWLLPRTTVPVVTLLLSRVWPLRNGSQEGTPTKG